MMVKYSKEPRRNTGHVGAAAEIVKVLLVRFDIDVVVSHWPGRVPLRIVSRVEDFEEGLRLTLKAPSMTVKLGNPLGSTKKAGTKCTAGKPLPGLIAEYHPSLRLPVPKRQLSPAKVDTNGFPL